MTHWFETTMRLGRSRDEVFRFFADAGNLEQITPPELRFRILTPLPIVMAAGTLIDYRLNLFGVPFGWRTRICDWEPPLRFVDEQLKGPYRRWVHTHTFREENGSTVMVDHVDYALPGWPLGEAAHPLVRRQIERIFAYRQTAIRRVLSSG